MHQLNRPTPNAKPPPSPGPTTLSPNSAPSPQDQATLLADMMELIKHIHLCSNLPALAGPALLDKATAWGQVLRPVPRQYLKAAYDRAALDHPGTYAPTAYEVLQGWLKVGEAHADRHVAAHAALKAAPLPLLSAPSGAPTTLPALLAQLVANLGTPASVSAVFLAYQALRRIDPQATVAEWAARLAAARAMDSAPTLESLVNALTKDELP